MGGVAENGAGAELLHPWGSATDYREAAAERVGWKWHYPSLEGAMKEAGFTDVRTSITRRQNTVTQFFATRPLLDLCKGATQRGRARVTMRWWDQKGIDWEKVKARGTATESEAESEADGDGEGTRDADSRAGGSSGA